MVRLLKWSPVLLALVLMLSGCSTTSRAYRTVDLSKSNVFDRYLSDPLSIAITWFAHHLWGQYGLAILVVTVAVRLIVLPLSIKQYRSSKAMQNLMPELKKIKEKYKDDTKKQQEETMKLYQQNGVNPLAGCFPVVIQMPVLWALYRSIMYNADIEKNPTFLWFNLHEPSHIWLPLIAGTTTFIQQKVMMATNPVNNTMKGLTYVFPVLIFVMASSFPAALPLYWIYGNIFTIFQTYFMYGGDRKARKGGASK